MLVSHNNESVVMLTRQTNCVEVELFSHVNTILFELICLPVGRVGSISFALDFCNIMIFFSVTYLPDGLK